MSDRQQRTRRAPEVFQPEGWAHRPERNVWRRRKTEILAKYNNCCNHCGISGTKTPLQGDHIIELAKGGKDVFSNIQPLCKKCHDEKTRGNRMCKEHTYQFVILKKEMRGRVLWLFVHWKGYPSRKDSWIPETNRV